VVDLLVPVQHAALARPRLGVDVGPLDDH
jgi:hypothetical protein